MKYFVNEEKGTVVCLIADCEKDFLNSLRKKMPIVYQCALNGMLDVSMKKKYVGIARCHGNDVFDAEFGKQLARSRALANYWIDYFADVCEVEEFICTISDYIVDGITDEKQEYALSKIQHFCAEEMTLLAQVNPALED